MHSHNIFQLKQKITFRQPRSWDIHTRYALVYLGEKIALEPGTWLLEKGAVEFKLSDGLRKEYLYRLASGEMVALDRPLTADETDLIDDPQIISAMNAFRTLEEAADEDWGVHVEHIDHLPPFDLIKCPLCDHTNFTSVDFAGVWCDHCNARFEAGYTAGDPGFVVDCTWDHVHLGASRYLIPASRNLGMRMVFKNSDDPRKMGHRLEDQAWYKNTYNCTPKKPCLTGDGHSCLRPGLHRCHLGDVYEWRMDGRAPSWVEMLEGKKNGTSWEVAGEMWPAVAYIPLSSLTYSSETTLNSLKSVLTEFKENDAQFPLGLREVLDTLDRMLRHKTKVGPPLGHARLPRLSALHDAERYLLHHWLIDHDPTMPNMEFAYPVWYVVNPVLGEEQFNFRPIKGWTVARRDICPLCGCQVTSEVYQKLQKTGNPSCKTPHRNCRDFWKRVGWTPEAPALSDPSESYPQSL